MIPEIQQRNVDFDLNRRAGDNANEQRCRAVVEQVPDGILIFDGESGRVLYSNATFGRLLELPAEELLGMRIFDFVDQDCNGIGTDIHKCLAGIGSSLFESHCHRDNGPTTEVEVSVAPIFYANRREWCAVVRDITERKSYEKRLEHAASHDSLTDLPNRALFLENLERAAAEANRQRTPVAVLFIDIDDFKQVNDTFGHHCGDLVLAATANRLRSCVRTGDTVGRIGGDEFAVLAERSVGPMDVIRLAERLTAELREPFAVGATGMQTHISASIGVSMGIPSTRGGETLLRRADAAMYRSKEAGKARWEFGETSA